MTEAGAEWSLARADVTDDDFVSRIGHSLDNIGRFLVTFGGHGPFVKEMKGRLAYRDIGVFDTHTRWHSKNVCCFKNKVYEDSDFDSEVKLDVIKHAATYVLGPGKGPDLENVLAVRRFGIPPPCERGFHAACTFGPGLFIHGGVSSITGADPYGDWNLFDLGLAAWIKIQVFWLPTAGMTLPDRYF